MENSGLLHVRACLSYFSISSFYYYLNISSKQVQLWLLYWLDHILANLIIYRNDERFDEDTLNIQDVNIILKIFVFKNIQK